MIDPCGQNTYCYWHDWQKRMAFNTACFTENKNLINFLHHEPCEMNKFNWLHCIIYNRCSAALEYVPLLYFKKTCPLGRTSIFDHVSKRNDWLGQVEKNCIILSFAIFVRRDFLRAELNGSSSERFRSAISMLISWMKPLCLQTNVQFLNVSTQ